MGASGSGKTYSLSTLLEAGLEVFVVSTEPHGLDTLLDAVSAKKLPLDKLHWKYIGPARPGFAKLEQMSKLISIANQKTLSDAQPGPRQDAAFTKMLSALCNFTDDKDGRAYGDVTAFDSSRALVIDSLSGVSSMAMDVTIGDKVTANPGEWGIAMRAIDKFLLTCTSDLKCFFVMTGHIEKEEDQISGASKVMISTLGKKLAPSIPKFFSEVVLTDTISKGNERRHYWSTNTPNTVLKNRALPISADLEPTFKPIVAAYHNRVAQLKGAA